jgi:hypothetical protein
VTNAAPAVLSHNDAPVLIERRVHVKRTPASRGTHKEALRMLTLKTRISSVAAAALVASAMLVPSGAIAASKRTTAHAKGRSHQVARKHRAVSKRATRRSKVTPKPKAAPKAKVKAKAKHSKSLARRGHRPSKKRR